MLVRLKTIMAGPMGNFPVGSVLDLPPVQAAELIAGGYAEPDGGPPQQEIDPLKGHEPEVEEATAPPPQENASIRRKRRNK